MYRELRLIGCLLVFPATGLHAQLNVNTNLTPAQLVQDVLLGAGVTATNITFNGVPSPATSQPGTGSWVTVNSNLGLNAGVILSSGFAQNIAAPATNFQSDNIVPSISDPDLFTIAGAAINNASVLEFDFIPIGDTIKFRYVFGSEEYPEWVCSQFNDAFGFFLSGPGISGPYQNGAINIALLPGTNTPVSINNVNNGDDNIPTPSCPAMNPQYYVINNGTSVVYDGMTVVLEAKRHVQCGQVYHIKLAIADAGDSAFDSGVFLEAGSFSSTPFVPSLTPGPGIIGTDLVQESCYPVQINFIRTGDTDLPSQVQIEVGGTATPGVDYNPPFPAFLDFPAGVQSIPFTLTAPIDPDGTETIVLTLTSASDCAGVDITNEFTFYIQNPPPLLASGYDVNIQCGDTAVLTPTVSGGYPPYDATWTPAGSGSGPSITVSPTQVTLYTATVVDDCGTTTTASFVVGLLELPPIQAFILGPNSVVEGCESTQINIIRPQGVPGDLTIDLVYSGTATNGPDYTMPATTVIPATQLNVLLPFQPLVDGVQEGPETVVILVSFTDDCGRTVDAQVTITILESPPIELVTEDVRIECAPDSMEIFVVATGGYNNQVNLVWSTGDTGPSATVTMQTEGTYTVTATDACGNTAYATVEVAVDCDIIVPNVFSPNGDGMNDYWVIDGLANRDNTVRVYNRWGNIVYEADNYRNNWGAMDVPDGTYFYEVLVLNRGVQEVHTGHLTVLRNRW